MHKEYGLFAFKHTMKKHTDTKDYFASNVNSCLILITLLAVLPDQLTSVQIPIKICMYKSGILHEFEMRWFYLVKGAFLNLMFN